MTSIKSQIEISATAQEVWATLADLGSVMNFHPYVEDSYYTSYEKSDIGAARICEFHNGMVVKETAVAWEEGKRYTLSIEITDGMAPPVENIRATLTLQALDDFRTVVSMDMRYEPKGLMGKVMDPVMIRPQYNKMVPDILQGLKYHLETGKMVTATTLKEIKLNAVIA